MKAEKQEYTVTTVKLTLDSKEAAWLKATMQNPLSDSETAEEQKIRREFWQRLNDIGIQ